MNIDKPILDPNYNTFKTRFYLDEVIGGKEGVVGLVDPTGDNAKMHNLTTRGGKGRIGNMQILNDGGLNTKALALWEDNPSFYNSAYNGFIVTIRCYSAYYVDTDYFGIKWTATSGNYTGAPHLEKMDGIEQQSYDMSSFLLQDQLTIDSYVYF